METGNFYEYDFLYPMVQSLVENMFKADGNVICLTKGTDLKGEEYPTTEHLYDLFYEEMKKMAPRILAKTKEVQDDGIRIGREVTQNSIKSALGIEFGSQLKG